MTIVAGDWEAALVARDGISRLTQSIPLHEPGVRPVGDCFRTALACILTADRPERVPHFTDLAGDERWGERRLARLWLRAEFGWDMMCVSLDAAKGYGVPYIVSVRSKRGDWSHAVVAKGDRVVHDPSGVGGYTLDDHNGDCVEVLCMPYDPDPDEMVRRWAAAERCATAVDSGE